jgi:hypothetical protein
MSYLWAKYSILLIRLKNKLNKRIFENKT